MGVLIQLLDRPIAYNPAFAKLKSGKIKSGPVAAVFLSQLVYWHNRMDGGWMYKTQADIATETALTRDEQETARKRLVALGVLEEARRGVPATMHYRINAERLEVLLLETTQPAKKAAPQDKTRLRNIQNVETPQSGLVHHRKQECGDAANKNVEVPQTSQGDSPEQVSGDPANFPTGDYTESTQEITQENKTSCPETSSPDGQALPNAADPTIPKGKWGTPEDRQCAEWIFSRIKKLYEKAAETDGEVSRPKDPNWNAWANEIRLMRTIDGRTHRQICDLFKRVQSDPFWCRNVLSPSKLREKWDELVIRLGTGGHHDVNAISEPDTEIPKGFRGSKY